MKRIGIIGASMGVAAALMNAGMDVVTLSDDRPTGNNPRRMDRTTHFAGNRSKYMPHIGAKEQARAKRCYMSFYLNEQVAQFHPRDGHMRASPTLCQIGKAAHEAYLAAREQEYESVF